jgi:ATP-dependent DNA helicase RecQ
MVPAPKGRRKDRENLDEVARITLGITELTPAQEEAIGAVLDGHDTLAILPTGAGKSAIYQVAANLLDGPTVVVSPLLALQRDQADKLEAGNSGDAALLNSTVSSHARLESLAAAERGDVEFLFLAPEQLANEGVLSRLIETKPSLLVVDEAHCISSWGHDFRPDYLVLGELVQKLGHPAVLALTATASTPVQEEIVDRLSMRRTRVVTQNLDRPNIHLELRRFDDEVLERAAIIDAVAAEQKPGIVYAATRTYAQALTDELVLAGIDAACYHAGLAGKVRDEVQHRFMSGGLDVVVATKAFGMGVDKADVRFVYHSEVSDSLDSYMQEIGRAGRDGKPANAVLFYRPSDLSIQRFFAGGRLQDADISAVLLAFSSNEARSRAQIVEASGLGPRKVMRVLNGLIDSGLLRRGKNGSYRPVPSRAPQAGLEAVESLQEQWHRVNESRVEMMRLYAEEDGCRRRLLLDYFGEHLAGPCGNCDNCDRGMERWGEPGAEALTVRHSLWGPGQVLRQEADRAVIFFQSVGYKTLDLKVALERGLLSKEVSAVT